jgi:condensin complex subunit 2
LIDYFHDMSLLRNQDDNTINFQRASCTLDGCVKIWTSRVDSVGTETTKLLSNIAQGGRGADDDHDANPDGEGSDGEGGEGGGTQRVKKKRGPGATLAKDPAQLRNKKPDLEFSVDPLFKKTCADFDEGGAQGLLMSHLALGVTQDGSLRIVFDASDAQPRRSDEEEDDLQEPEEQIDLELLRAEFFPDLSVLDDGAISHSLAGFTFGQDVALDNVKLGLANGLDSDDEDFGALPPPPQYDGDVPMDGEGGDFAPPPVEDFFMGDQAVEDDYGGDVDAFAGREEERSESGSVAAFGGQYAGGGGGGANAPLVAFDPRRPSEQQFVEAMAAGDSNSLDYFDRGFVKNWAGPEHWKLRRPIPKGESDWPWFSTMVELLTCQPADAAGGTTKGKQKEKKEAFRIDFTSEQEGTFKQRTKTLFAGVTKGATINLPVAARRKIDKEDKEELKDKDLNLLPDDMHFTSRSLVTLFLKPGFQVEARLSLDVHKQGISLTNMGMHSSRCGAKWWLTITTGRKSTQTIGHEQPSVPQMPMPNLTQKVSSLLALRLLSYSPSSRSSFRRGTFPNAILQRRR